MPRPARQKRKREGIAGRRAGMSRSVVCASGPASGIAARTSAPATAMPETSAVIKASVCLARLCQRVIRGECVACGCRTQRPLCGVIFRQAIRGHDARCCRLQRLVQVCQRPHNNHKSSAEWYAQPPDWMDAAEAISSGCALVRGRSTVQRRSTARRGSCAHWSPECVAVDLMRC